MDVEVAHPPAEERHADPSVPAAAAMLAPWVVASAFLPAPAGPLAVLLGLALFALVAAAGRWAFERARAVGLDATRWSALTALTMGFAMLALLRARPPALRFSAQVQCGECGRIGELAEPFCFGCGALG